MREQLRRDYIVAAGKTHKEWLAAKTRWIADLRHRYRGIDVSAELPDAKEHAKQFGELMREWNPIMCSVADLKSIAGAPSTENDEMLEYRFATGVSEVVWRFTITGDTIFGVTTFPSS
jgi:hypothetical protein